jgi:hypothetical protein
MERKCPTTFQLLARRTNITGEIIEAARNLYLYEQIGNTATISWIRDRHMLMLGQLQMNECPLRWITIDDLGPSHSSKRHLKGRIRTAPATVKVAQNAPDLSTKSCGNMRSRGMHPISLGQRSVQLVDGNNTGTTWGGNRPK